MRFAYMDEKGRQVHISSVEDLGERIRLGEVDDETELYDALEDRWGPARGHAMYASVRAQLGGVAPAPDPAAPPVPTTPPPSVGPPSSPPAAGSAGSATSDDEAALERDWSSALRDEFLGVVPGAPAAPAGMGPAMPTESLESPTSPTPPPPPATPTEDPLSPVSEASPPPALPSTDMEPIDGASNVFVSFDQPVASEGEAEVKGGTNHPFEDPAQLSDATEALQFERFMPKPESAPAAAPAPLDLVEEPSPESSAKDPEEDFFLIDDLSVSDEDVSRTPEKKAKRGSGRKRVGVPAMLPAVVGIALAVLLTSVALPRLVRLGSAMWASREGTEVVEASPGVEDLPEQLTTEAFFLAARAQQQAFSALDSIRRNLGVEAAPPSDWMEGVYFARASQYPAAQSYWERYRSYLLYARRELPGLFEASFRRQIAASSIGAGNQEQVLDLILSDFEGRSAAMEGHFDELSGLADAALELHAFLVLKEDDIEYTPFTRSGVSRDPIVEAVPGSEQTRIDFWERLEKVTTRLEALDALGRVTTAKLQVVLLTGLGEVGY